MARPHLGLGREREQLLVQGTEYASRPVLPVDREVRPRDVVDEKRVSREDRPGLVAAPAVHERERRVLGAVTRRVERAYDERAELELPAVVEWLVVVGGVCL